MTREDVQKALEDGKLAHYHAWTFMKHYMICCDDSFTDIEQTLDTLEHFCSGRWEEVEIDE